MDGWMDAGVGVGRYVRLVISGVLTVTLIQSTSTTTSVVSLLRARVRWLAA